MLGIPRGVWVMGKDQIEDLRTIAIDLPRALINFIVQNPTAALKILGTIVRGPGALVTYTLPQTSADAIVKAFAFISRNK